ncbi:hypothetical protein [Chengkuizengella sediminis]|uniref:hypothetical protein n=1 Tax=Chengkuizengella sediminis TaxID=1885917 RepID=UPI00138953BD|nr:hypothetical protein [Chengkuizengella sediminis]NDI37242.1 hypothetical protein [Chengkuizengella sediminis]
MANLKTYFDGKALDNRLFVIKINGFERYIHAKTVVLIILGLDYKHQKLVEKQILKVEKDNGDIYELLEFIAIGFIKSLDIIDSENVIRH